MSTSKSIEQKANKITVKKRQPNKRGNYILGETLGEGAFAKVKLATHVYTQEKVAIKILNKQKLTDPNSDIERIKKEINILKKLRHKNIIQLYEVMESESVLYIVMEYCEGKELFDYIIRRRHLNEREACRFFQQIINGVEYLHLSNITHRDLKPENLLLDNKKRIKISDFGLSNTSKGDNDLLQTPCGTPSYAPPEMLKGEEYDGCKSDIWSCGIILYTMLVGNLPCAESKEELIYQVMVEHNYDFPSYLSPAAIDLMSNMLKIDPEERYDFTQIKKHPWFHLVQPQMKPGLLFEQIKIPIDEGVLDKVENFGFNKEDCKKSILENKYNSHTAFYYLILKQMAREGKTSISDLFSNDFVNYLKDANNWKNPEKLKEPKYKEYITGKILIDAMYSQRKANLNIKTELNHQNSIHHFLAATLKKNYAQTTRNHQYDDYLFLDPEKEEKRIVYTEKELKIFSDDLSADLREKILKYLNEQNETFDREIKCIDSYGKNNNSNNYNPPIQNIYNISNSMISNSFYSNWNIDDSLQGNDDPENQNVLNLIANKLIKTTIFGKYLPSNEKKIEDHHIPIKGELVDKFYRLQKYKNIINVVKLKHIGIFPKKIYDWNYYTFEEFLNNPEDQVFTDNFLQSVPYANFIKQLKKSSKNKTRLQNHCRSLSKNVRITHKFNTINKEHDSIILNTSDVSSNSYDTNNNNFTKINYFKETPRLRRTNKFIGISTYVKNAQKFKTFGTRAKGKDRNDNQKKKQFLKTYAY